MPRKHAADTSLTRRGALSLAGMLAAQTALPALGQDRAASTNGAPPDSITRQRFKIGGSDVAFTVTAGTLPMLDSKGERQAWMFYTSYVRDGAPKDARPVTFAFNGGPGTSSAYLHIGVLGPRIVTFGDDMRLKPPPRLVDNPDSWLDLTDLVFIDPIGTSYSRTVGGTEQANKSYWGVRGDIQSLASFIDLYLARNARQGSPKYIVGESYGGFRAARVAHLLASEHGTAMSGLFLISPVLDFSLIGGDPLALLPDVLMLPSYAAVALERSAPPTAAALAEVERFALGPYLTALAATPRNDADLKNVYGQVAKYIGLPPEMVAQYGGRVPEDVFVKEVRRADRMVVSHYDATIAGPDPFPEATAARSDPVVDSLRASLGSAMADYFTSTLGVRTDIPYVLQGVEIYRVWDWWSGLPSAGGYVSAVSQLREALATNRGLKLVAAHGMTDLVTPYFTTRYALNHIPPDVAADRVTFNLYPGGHMMYLRPASRTRLHTDAVTFYGATAK